MAAAPDSLRSTLDTLRLDPKAREDRHYLVTLLRRLGYTEEEIEQELGPAEPVEETPLAEIDSRRVVEVEYLGSGEVEEFEPVARARNGQLAQTTSFEVEEELVEFQRLEPEVGKRLRVKVVRADDPHAAAQAARSQGLHVVRTVPVRVRTDERNVAHGAPAWSEADANWDDVEDSAEWQQPQAWPEQPQSDLQAAEPETQAWGTAEPAQPAPEPADTTGWEEAGWDEGSEWQEAAPAAPAEEWSSTGDDAPFQYRDYTLHTREVQLSPDRMQRIYFFAKSTPASGVPCGLPDGYEVRENDKTGLPFLARAEAA